MMMTSLLWRYLFIEHSLSVYYFLHQFSVITHNSWLSVYSRGMREKTERKNE